MNGAAGTDWGESLSLIEVHRKLLYINYAYENIKEYKRNEELRGFDTGSTSNNEHKIGIIK